MKPWNLKIVILESPYYCWDLPQARELFGEMIRLKLATYSGNYKEGILPVGDADFIADHKLICEQLPDGKLVPLMGSHTTTSDCAAHHLIQFPPLGLAQSCASPDHVAAVEAVMARCRREGRRLGYEAGWAISPAAKKSRELTIELHRIYLGIKALYIQDYGIDEMLVAGSIRFGVDRTCEFWGYQPIELEGRRLEPIAPPRYNGERAMLVHMPELSAQAREYALSYKLMWANRITIKAAEEVRKIA